MAKKPLDFDKLVKSYGELFSMVQILDKDGKIVNKSLVPELSDEELQDISLYRLPIREFKKSNES